MNLTFMLHIALSLIMMYYGATTILIVLAFVLWVQNL
jgi:hypothetical protein